jgi:hypothetical protein
MLATGEDEQVEFKPAARVDPHTHKPANNLVDGCIQAVAAFLNSRKGGNILISINDDGSVNGLSADYADLKSNKADRDKFEQFLRSTIGDRLGREFSPLIGVMFFNIQSNDVCWVTIKPASSPAYLDGELYIRCGNTSPKLKAKAAQRAITATV